MGEPVTSAQLSRQAVKTMLQIERAWGRLDTAAKDEIADIFGRLALKEWATVDEQVRAWDGSAVGHA